MIPRTYIGSRGGRTRQRYSCSHTAFVYQEAIQSVRDKGNKVYVAFLDVRKAFDTVWHKGLLVIMKIHQKGIRGSIWNIIDNWYASSSSPVLWNSAVSKSFSISQGVRQGGILSPLLYYGVPNESKSHSCVTPEICSVLLIYRTCYLYIRRATYISDVLLIYQTCYLYIGHATYISDVLLIYRTCYLYIRRATYISDMLLIYQTCYLYIGRATYISDVLLIYQTCYLYIGRATYISDMLLIYRTCYTYVSTSSIRLAAVPLYNSTPNSQVNNRPGHRVKRRVLIFFSFFLASK